MRVTFPACCLAVGLAACGTFVEDPTGPGTPPPPAPGGPIVAVPFKLGTTQPEEGRAVAYSGGGILLASWFTGTVDFDPSTTGATGKTSFGAQDIAVARYGLDGTFGWVFSIGGAGGDVPNAIAATADGGAVVVGYGNGGGLCGGRLLTSAGGRDILLLRIGADGTCQWAQLLGGPGDDEARGVAVAADGTIYVVGSFSGTADFNDSGSFLLQSLGLTDGFLARFDTDGTLLDAVRTGGTGEDRLNAVAFAPTGELSVGGEFTGTATFGTVLAPVLLQSAGGLDGSIARYTPLLGLRWANRLGGPAEDRVTAVTHDFDGNLLAAGTFEGTADLDPSGGTSLVVSLGAADIFLARYDGLSGAWDGLSRAVGGTGSESVNRIIRHVSGRLLLTGFFQETADFDPGAGARLVPARGTGGAGDAFVLGITSTGDFSWVVPIGGVVGGAGNLSIGYDLATDELGRVWATGRFFGRADFDPGTEAVELVSASQSDIYLSRYDIDTGALRAEPLP
jgi:hypothetical protein